MPLRTRSVSFAPTYCESTMEMALVTPVASSRMRPVVDVVAPMAASACEPTKRPSTAESTME